MRRSRITSRYAWYLVAAAVMVASAASVAGQTLSGSANVTFVSEDRKTSQIDTVQVGGVDSLVLDTVNIDRNAVTQDYAASLLRNITPWVTGRASVRFYRTGSEQTAISDFWREEFQPSAELSWSHPLFSLIGTVQRRESKGTSLASDLTRESITTRLQTRSNEWPLLQLNYSFERSYNDAEPAFEEIKRDASTHRLEGRLEYDYKVHSFTYAASRRWSSAESGQLALDPTNQSTILRQTDTDTDEFSQLFRWLQTSFHLDQKLRVNSSYTLRHTVINTTRAGGFRGVSAREALYANDVTPDQGALTAEPGLTDRDRQSPTSPAINIGTGETGQNFGLDFGIAQEINAIYVYTDRPSGEQVTWRVFTSSDNLTWTEAAAAPGSIFNPTENRYEIVFPTVQARYVKVVLGGFNRIETVYVTEVEAYLQADNIEDEEINTVSHVLDISNTYTASDKVRLSADLNYLREPSGSFDQTREEYYVGLGANYEPSGQFLHTVRVQRGFQNFSIGDQNQSNATYNYSLIYTPLDRLQFTVAAASIQDFLESERIQENNSVIWEATGTPFRDINMSTGITYSRNNRFRFGESFASWTYRGSLDGRLSTAISGIVSVSHQRLTNQTTDELRIRNQYSGGVDIRLSRTIFGSANVSLIDDIRTSTQQDYTVSWNLSNRLTLGGLASLSDDGDGFRTEQWDGRINLRIRTRASVNAGVSRTEVTGTGGFESTSFRVGFRTGF